MVVMTERKRRAHQGRNALNGEKIKVKEKIVTMTTKSIRLALVVIF